MRKHSTPTYSNAAQKEFEKLRDQTRKRELNEVLREQPETLLASADPAQQRLRSEIEVVDLEVKIAELTGQLKTEERGSNQLSAANSKAPGTVAQAELNTGTD